MKYTHVYIYTHIYKVTWYLQGIANEDEELIGVGGNGDPQTSIVQGDLEARDVIGSQDGQDLRV